MQNYGFVYLSLCIPKEPARRQRDLRSFTYIGNIFHPPFYRLYAL
jgi:hypothetical protein